MLAPLYGFQTINPQGSVGRLVLVKEGFEFSGLPSEPGCPKLLAAMTTRGSGREAWEVQYEEGNFLRGWNLEYTTRSS
jgi:hypothetical protein